MPYGAKEIIWEEVLLSEQSLRNMLRHASIPTLLMCLAQITGEERWLQEPFLPKRDTNLFADESGGLLSTNRRKPVQKIVDRLSGFQVRLKEPTAVNNGGDQYALLLYAIDDAVAVHKSLADRSVVNLRNNAS